MTTQIKDTTGRIGTVTEDRGDVLFARPAGSQHLDGNIITSTAWHVTADGTLRGLWYDSPPNGFVDAVRA